MTLVTGWSTCAMSLPCLSTEATNVYVSEPCENVTVSFLSPVCASFHVQCFLAPAWTNRTAFFE